MENYFNEVRKHAEAYFREHLPQYTLLEIRRKSNHPDDSYLFMVSAGKSDGAYAVWTCWNESIQSLNHGHYGLKTLEDCEEVFRENTGSGCTCLGIYRQDGAD